uniref:Secreted protein n=1 Tax=Zea mays TaxID=4577 RepID=C4J276_MAIZE|nr:unknown [Zea mays]
MYAHACLLVVTHTLLTGTWPHQLAWSVASIVSLRPTQPGEALPLDEPQQELHHLGGLLERVGGAGLLGVLGHQDADALALAPAPQRPEGVLVGAVVADVHGQDVGAAREAERLEQELERLALVPLDGGPHLQHHPPLRQPQPGVLPQNALHRLPQLAPHLFVDASEVDGDAEPVVLHLGPGYAARRLYQALVHSLYHGQELARRCRLEQDSFCLGLLVPGRRGLGRTLDVHAVAAGVVELRQLHEPEHLVAAPAAHDRRREMLGDATHGHPHRLAHEGGVGVVHDGRQRAVVVQEHDDAPALGRRHDPLELAQRRRVPRHPGGALLLLVGAGAGERGCGPGVRGRRRPHGLHAPAGAAAHLRLQALAAHGGGCDPAGAARRRVREQRRPRAGARARRLRWDAGSLRHRHARLRHRHPIGRSTAIRGWLQIGKE